MIKYNFKIGDEEFETDGTCKYVFLNDEKIYRIDSTLYMGHKRNQLDDVSKALSTHLKVEVTKDQVKRALLFGYIEVEEPKVSKKRKKSI
jgi:hypothetical protein